MKSHDWSVIAVIMFLSAVLSLAVSNFTIGSRKSSKLKVEQVSTLTADFPLPNKQYFNGKSINPTQEIKIGEDTNKNPFQSN